MVDTHFEASGRPVHKVDMSLRLHDCEGSRDIFGRHVTTVHQARSHVLGPADIALGELSLILEALGREVCHGVSIVESSLGGDQGRVGTRHEVNARVRDEVCLEFVQVDIESTTKTDRAGNGGDNLGHGLVQILVGGAFRASSAADVISRFVIQNEADISVFQEAMGAEDRVIGFHNRG